MADQNAQKLDTLHHVAITVSDIQKTFERYTQQFHCTVKYQDETWALVQFANISLAFVSAAHHPPHFAIIGDPSAYGQPKKHRDGTRSVYLKDPAGNDVEILALQ